MMTKFALYLLIFLCCGFAGMLRASVFTDRANNLQDLITTFKILESEMKYRLDPLPETFNRIAAYKKNRASDLLLTVSERLSGGDLGPVWTAAVDETFRGAGLKEEDLQIVRDMALELGRSGLPGQESMFVRTRERLAQQLAEALEEKKSKGRMYRSLGFAIGAVIVILLI